MKSQDEESITKDINIPRLVRFVPRKYLSLSDVLQSNEDDETTTVGSDESFVELTQQLLTPEAQRGGAAGKGTITPTSEEANEGPTLVNKNVFLHFVLLFLQGTGHSLWSGAILSTFVVQLGSTVAGERSNYFRYAGYMEGMFGFGKILAGMLYPGGGRQNIQKRRQQQHDSLTPGPGRQNSLSLMYAGMTLVVTALANIILLAKLPNQHELLCQLLMPILLLYGYSTSVILSSCASYSLLRESTATKQNQKRYLDFERPVVLISHMVGALISIIIFANTSNTYTINNLRMVWYVGCGLEIVVGILASGFSERYCVMAEVEEEEAYRQVPRGKAQYINPGYAGKNHDEDGIKESKRELQLDMDQHFETLEAQGTADANKALEALVDGSPLVEPLLPLESSGILNDNAAATETGSGDGPLSTTHVSHPTASTNTDRHNVSRMLSLPPSFPFALFVLFVLLFVGGSALFHPYWPIFFEDVFQLPPIQLQTLYVVIPFALILFDAAFEKCFKLAKTSHHLGISAIVRLLATVLVLLIGTFACWGGGSYIVAIIFVLRMCSIGSVERAETEVFALYFANAATAWWKYAVDMAMMIVWSVCAAVGGVLVEYKSQGDSSYGSGSVGGGYGYVIRLSGWLEISGFVLLAIAMIFFRRKGC